MGLRLVAVVHRTVAGLVSLPSRVAGWRLRVEEADVAAISVRPVAVLRRAGDRSWGRIADALLRAVPVATLAGAGVFRAVVDVLVVRPLDDHPHQALALARVCLLADGLGICGRDRTSVWEGKRLSGRWN